jgi:hypothetical protein
MKIARLVPVFVGLFLLGLLAADASAMYHPAMGRFVQRDPGPDDLMNAPRLAGGMVNGGGFLPRDAMSSPAAMATAMPSTLSNAMPSVGLGAYRGSPMSLPRNSVAQYADGGSLYQYVRSSPPEYVDPTGRFAVGGRPPSGRIGRSSLETLPPPRFPVDPYKDCGLTANSSWSGDKPGQGKPGHFWIAGEGDEVWDFGPSIPDIRSRYDGSDNYMDCGLLHPCKGQSPYTGGEDADPPAFAGKRSNSVPLKLSSGTIQVGPAAGKKCACATCGDIKGCLDTVRYQWKDDNYDHWFHSCLSFSIDAKSKCCLKE